MMNRGRMRIMALGMAAVLGIAALTPQTVFAEGEAENAIIVIQTPEDFLELAKKCTLDAWSRGKTVVLAEDIDLTGMDFSPIPIFGGTFHGNGRRITGLRLEDGSSYQGLFRFIEEGGLVEGLTVSGYITAGGVQEYIGGIAGSNGGTIRNCSFEGYVDGPMYVGGIAGINEKAGEITGCLVIGTIQGDKYVGGVTGMNEGGIGACENEARINPAAKEENRELETAVPESVRETVRDRAETSLSAMSSGTEITQDIGGIAGYSKGVIRDSSNMGAVGYPHAGYNVGGIAGRSMGYLSGCTNSGRVYGRKDVGGIAGQLAPDIQLVFSTDTLDKLDKELSILSDLADDASDHTDENRDVISKRLDLISDYAREASDHTSDLADMTVDWADENIEEINSMMDMLEDTVDRLDEITGGIESIFGTMEDGIDALEDSLDEAGSALGIGKQGEKEIRELIGALRSINNSQKESAAVIRENLKGILGSLAEGDLDGVYELSESIKEEIGEITENAAEYKETLSELSDITADLPDIGVKLRNGVSDLNDAMDSMSHASRDMTDVADQVHKLFRDLSDRDEIRFKPLGDAYKEKGDQVHDSLSSIGDQLDLLGDEVDSTGDALSDDLKRLKDQMKVIDGILDDAKEEIEEKDRDDLWEDVSEEEIHNTTVGKAENCKNTGTIEGDISIGGIAGAMAVESDLDPEDDIDKVGSDSFNFRYETRAILESCVNTGTVTARRDGAGGAVGRMDLGYVLNCENYGAVESTDGSYVGGIAGSSASTIRGSYSKCMLSGKNFVGGIAGDSYNLYQNTAFVEIAESEMYAGAVAGRADKEGELSGNRFVDRGQAGIDGVSYAGKAEPVEYEQVMAEEETPERFGGFTVVYMADDNITARVSCSYGDRVEDLAVPTVPEKTGYRGVWEDMGEETITFDHVRKAVYTPDVTTVESDTMRDTVHAVILAEGIFDGETVLSAESVSADGKREEWKVHLGTAGNDGPYTYRFIPPAGWKHLTLRLITSDGETNAEWTRDQSACVFTADSTEFVLVAERTDGPAGLGWLAGAAAAAGILAVLGLATFLLRKVRRAKR